jgi:dienelactone hydrolase
MNDAAARVSFPIGELTPAFPSPVARDDVRPKLLELLGLESVPDEVAFNLEEPTVEGGLRVQRLAFVNSLGETVPGVLCAPLDRADQDIPGVVCLPGTGGSAEQLADRRFIRPDETSGPLVGWSRELARRGFVTLAITVKGTEVRRPGGTIEGWHAEAKLLAPYGRSQMGIVVEESLSAARVLTSLDGVDPERIGLTGMSLGGNATWYSMACAPWIAAGVPICGSPSSLDTVVKLGDPERHSSYFYIPHMLRYFDHADVVAACIAPRPFMIVAPTEDEDTPREGVDRMADIVRPVYEAAGHPERFQVHQPSGKHLYRIEYFELVVDWFRRHLAVAD